jgi:acyl-CoA thioesterase FadM
MFASFFDDGLNPRFVFQSPVFRDELDPAGRLSSERLAQHVAGAVDTFHAGNGGLADQVDVVRDLTIEFLSPVTSAGILRVDIWLEALDATTCTYGFLCSSSDGNTPHARGERTVSRVDAERLRPSTWSDDFMQKQTSILKNLHAI